MGAARVTFPVLNGMLRHAESLGAVASRKLKNRANYTHGALKYPVTCGAKM
jgi:hypothetical protein